MSGDGDAFTTGTVLENCTLLTDSTLFQATRVPIIRSIFIVSVNFFLYTLSSFDTLVCPLSCQEPAAVMMLPEALFYPYDYMTFRL
jgi:hypothetical protein